MENPDKVIVMDSHLPGESGENPYARVLCRVRKITPTLCDGTCIDCKKEKEIYRIKSITKLIFGETMRSGGDPDYPIPTYEEAKKRVDDRLVILERRKKKIFLRKS